MAMSLHLHYSILLSLHSANPNTTKFHPGHPRLRSGAKSIGFVPKSVAATNNWLSTKEIRTGLKRQRCNASYGSPGSTGALTPELKEALDKFIASNKVVLFMKGTKDFPQCGFSNTLVQILNSLNAQFETVNILENDALRQGLKEYSSWPTFPQLYIDGEFFGGCDITVEAYKNGELQKLLKATTS